MSLLPDADTFKSLADGSMRGPGPAALRAVLAAISVPYRGAVAIRNTAYDRALTRVHRGPVPVISVGNLTLGGTGKTPLVAWVARTLQAAGHGPAIVSRGYGARPGEVSDEAAELAVVVPGVPHIANRDRVAAVHAAAAQGATVVVLDDGFQHRRLARDLDIVAIDATDPFGCGRLFPRGLLREPATSLRRAQSVVLTRASSVSAERRAEIRQAVTAASGGQLPAIWAEATHRPVALRDRVGTLQNLERLRGRRIAAFAGIGNPAAFRATLSGLGAEVVAFTAFADHHAYHEGDIASLAAACRQHGVDLAVTTLKDLVKFRSLDLDGIPLVALEIAATFSEGEKLLRAAVIEAALHADPLVCAQGLDGEQ
ncbi:MAG: tetraacyldisaccharide 4'-kinase [Pirellulales bacterium]